LNFNLFFFLFLSRKSSMGDTETLIRCSSASSISVLSRQTLERSSQYRSCLHRTDSEIVNDRTADLIDVSHGPKTSIVPESCISSNDSAETCDLISSMPNYKPLITKNRVEKSPEKPKFQRERTFEDWLVEKMKKEASIKKTGEKAHSQWVKEKLAAEKAERQRQKKLDEQQQKNQEIENQKRRKNEEKAKNEFEKWLEEKEHRRIELKKKEFAQKKKLEAEENEKKKRNEEKFKEWLKKVNETNPDEKIFVNKNPWIPPIPKHIPTKKRSLNSPCPRTAVSASEIRRKPLLMTNKSSISVNWR